MVKANVAVLVSGGGTNLQALIDRQNDGSIAHVQIVAVISNKPGVYALERAAKAGIPSFVINRKELGGEEFERQLSAILEETKTDVIVLAGFLSILSAQFTSRWPERIINVHPALIPSFCGKGMYGLKVHEAALAKGVKVSGATVHFVNEIPDGGRIIFQKAVEVKEGDTPEVLQRRIMEEAEWVLLPAAVEKVCKEICEK